MTVFFLGCVSSVVVAVEATDYRNRVSKRRTTILSSASTSFSCLLTAELLLCSCLKEWYRGIPLYAYLPHQQSRHEKRVTGASPRYLNIRHPTFGH
ncbi:hypothetical protein B0T12DRAFT_416640 [Alternaria alternata]|jgi:hypothetical protein|nr:hypothetical protein B0T12DRAFT_416640 [Alternaria alternata]